MKHVLAIDTSGPSLSVALTREGRVVFECVQQNGKTHSDSLMCLVEEALAAGSIAPKEVDLFAVVHGPGSFTGVRIGVAAAKGLARATEKPCIGINALEALAAGASLFGGLVCPMQDARAGQVYCAAYQGGKQMLPDEAMKLDAFLQIVQPYGRCCFVGDGCAAHRMTIQNALGENAAFAQEGWMMIHAAHVAVLAQKRLSQVVSYQALSPYYLRAPQAERERASREAARG